MMITEAQEEAQYWLYHNEQIKEISYSRESCQKQLRWDWRDWYSQNSEDRHCRSLRSRRSYLNVSEFECEPKECQQLRSQHET